MPELPEVETVKRILSPQICGHYITGVTVSRLEVLAHPTVDEFNNLTKLAVIQRVERLGKYLIICLANGCSILVHLRMTGQLLCTPAEYPVKPHTHVVFQLDNTQELRFTDVRRFGRIWLKRAEEQDTFSGIHKLGVEPFDKAFGREYLKSKLGNRRISIKQGLLDQTVIAGLGNIYADEALFMAGISPNRSSAEMKEADWQALTNAIPQILVKAIANNDMSEMEYLFSEGKEYRNSNFLEVYGRAGEPCRHCSTPIKRIKIGGRSSFYCSQCQKGEGSL